MMKSVAASSVIAYASAQTSGWSQSRHQDLFNQYIKQHGAEYPDQYREYFEYKDHKMMDYKGYQEALERGETIPESRLPGADFNMKVTNSNTQ